MGFDTSAIMKGKENFHRRPKSKFKSLLPKVLILEPFAAKTFNESAGGSDLKVEKGITDTSDPVSIRYDVRVLRSKIPTTVSINIVCRLTN